MTHESLDMRTAWQNQMLAENFPDDAQGPFLPPRTASDESLALAAIHHTAQNNVAFFGKLATSGGQDILHQSPNWNALAGGLQPSVPLAEDPYAQSWIADRASQIEAQDQRMRELYPKILEELRKGVAEGVEEGYLVPAMAKRLEDAFIHTAVQTVDEVALPNEFGAYTPGRDIVELSSAAPNSDTDIAVLVAHELIGHKAAGGTFRQDQENGSIVRSRIGFAELGANNLLDEAVEHHLALSCVHRDFAVVDPDKREDGNRVFYGIRKVAAAFVDRSEGLIDLRNITRASGEDTDDTRTETTDRRAMHKQARAAYGPGAYRKLGILLEAADAIDPNAPDVQEQLQAVTERIHSPTAAPDGTRIPGYIDIANLQS